MRLLLFLFPCLRVIVLTGNKVSLAPLQAPFFFFFSLHRWVAFYTGNFGTAETARFRLTCGWRRRQLEGDPGGSGGGIAIITGTTLRRLGLGHTHPFRRATRFCSGRRGKFVGMRQLFFLLPFFVSEYIASSMSLPVALSSLLVAFLSVFFRTIGIFSYETAETFFLLLSTRSKLSVLFLDLFIP